MYAATSVDQDQRAQKSITQTFSVPNRVHFSMFDNSCCWLSGYMKYQKSLKMDWFMDRKD